jgi:hypothetical protein
MRPVVACPAADPMDTPSSKAGTLNHSLLTCSAIYCASVFLRIVANRPSLLGDQTADSSVHQRPLTIAPGGRLGNACEPRGCEYATAHVCGVINLGAPAGWRIGCTRRVTPCEHEGDCSVQAPLIASECGLAVPVERERELWIQLHGVRVSSRLRKIHHDIPGKAHESMQLAFEETLLVAVGAEAFWTVFDIGGGAYTEALHSLSA